MGNIQNSSLRHLKQKENWPKKGRKMMFLAFYEKECINHKVVMK